MSEKTIPLVLLTYANERHDPARHLRNLSEEVNRIEQALDRAQQHGLCEVKKEGNITADRLFSLFQDTRYRNRIAVLHYAGHADGGHMLMESSSGASAALGAQGLAGFLGQQQGLQLVFLNGCSTKGHVEGLLNAGCRKVIATEHMIDDEVAVQFASRFYEGLGSGVSIKQACDEAETVTSAKKGDNLRKLYFGNGADLVPAPDGFPWCLHVKPGSESTQDWSLPKAAGDPLFGLPELPADIEFPDSPFRHLDWFERQHARVCFGRGSQIRDLYQKVTAQRGAPVIRYYGQSGTGKSSVLAAGLLPRLEAEFEVEYLRRDSAPGLLGTLVARFASTNPGEAWLSRERAKVRPLVVVLDQAEEVFTKPGATGADELPQFAAALHQIFGRPEQRPRGRLILGLRKEWLAEIRTALENQGLPRGSVFLQTLDRLGVIEAITGAARSPNRPNCYELDIDAGLAVEIADDLLADYDSPVAPTLQILLTKLWRRARQKSRDKPRFTRALYYELKREGTLLGDFLDQKVLRLEEWQPEVAQSGLALNVHAYHTTPLGTAVQHPETDIFAQYWQVGVSLVSECKGSHLLNDLYSEGVDSPKGSRLAHDTLAPLVRKRFEKSDKPGQRARRVLENRAVDWKNKRKGAELDQADLKIVEKGLMGMRALKPDEQPLLGASRRAVRERRRLRTVWLSSGAFLIGGIGALGVYSFWQERIAKHQERVAVARFQVAKASAHSYPNAGIRTLLLAAEAVKRTSEQDDDFGLGEAETVLHEELAKVGVSPLVREEGTFLVPVHTKAIAYDPKGRWLATGGADGELLLWTDADAKPLQLKGHCAKPFWERQFPRLPIADAPVVRHGRG